MSRKKAPQLGYFSGDTFGAGQAVMVDKWVRNTHELDHAARFATEKVFGNIPVGCFFVRFWDHLDGPVDTQLFSDIMLANRVSIQAALIAAYSGFDYDP